jgi:HprK-related kinase A
VTDSNAAQGGIPLLREIESKQLHRMLSTTGLRLDVGAVSIRVQSDSSIFARQLQAVYANFPAIDHAPWADLHVRIHESTGVRRWLKPQALFFCDGLQAFDPFPAASPLPLFEWGCNWLIGRRLNDRLLLHAGAVERDGLALILPAMPGSGKSTLTAALSQHGWRLLSDEFGAYDPLAGHFQAVLKPIALKNESIAVIRRFARGAAIGQEFPGTRKGTVAHLAPTADAVKRTHLVASPGAIVLPRWEAGAPTQLIPLPESTVFPALAFNAFNYSLLGADGFRSVVKLVRQCLAWQLVYSELEEALGALDAIWARVMEQQLARPE